MNSTVDLTTEQSEQIKTMLQKYLPDTEVWIYGSRCNGTARSNSDLDMCAFIHKDQRKDVARLREAFDESNLPFRVELFTSIPDAFKEQIEKQHIVLMPPPKEEA